MATLIRASGATVTVTPRDPARGFTLPECYALLGCTMIQALTLRDGRIMVMDEEGKLKPEPLVNQLATRLSELEPYDRVVGHVLVCDGTEFK